MNKYLPNGTEGDIEAGVLHSIDGYYVSNEGTAKKPNFHVWIPNGTHAICDTAFGEISLAVARCNYIAREKVTVSRYKN